MRDVMDEFSELKKKAKNFLWQYRAAILLVLVLLFQVSWSLFIAGFNWREFIPMVATSGFAFLLFSKSFEAYLANLIYGGIRKGWREVRVFHSSEFTGMGLGGLYPREPTILISPNLFAGDHSLKPMSVLFNDGFVGTEEEFVNGTPCVSTGNWSTLMRMSHSQVGFPNTRMFVAQVPIENSDTD